MRMHETKPVSLHETIRRRDGGDGRSVFAAEATVAWSEFLITSVLDGRGDELRGRSVLLATKDQLTTVRAMIELDGIAARIVLYPPDLSLEHLSYVVEAAGTDVLVSDRMRVGQYVPRVRYYVPCCEKISSLEYERGPQAATEWVLLTSGTTGPPKLVAHTLASLTGAIATGSTAPDRMVWSTFYDIRRYGGLQIFLRAAFTGASLVLSSADEATGDFLARAAGHTVTHISGTPSHWRRALMSPSAHRIDPEYVRLSGEIADQGILNQLRSTYPLARIAHAFASTEAGLAFDVDDGAAGFPASAIRETPGVEMKVIYGSLRIRSGRTASCYLGEDAPALMDAEGFVDTCDLLELRDGRYHFVGRRDGMINVGGMKVHPEEVEAVINRHPGVQMSLVRAKKNPITGSLVVADVVLRGAPENSRERVDELQDDILHFCRQTLSSHKVPAAINVVATLRVAESGKLVRPFA
jgi:acyl-coenzyme A synthetase/AMP-(fatty) acid ligase